MKQRLILRTADRMLFVSELLRLGSQGAHLVVGTVPTMSAPYSAELELEVVKGKELVSTPFVHAIPLPVTTYSKAQMEEMIWDDFREACNALGVKGRERAVMLEEYLRKSGHYTRNTR